MPLTLEVPTPSDPVGPVVPETPTVPADPVPGPVVPDAPSGPDAPEPNGALSHQHERAFSASLIYLGLGTAGAIAIGALDIDWIDPVADAEVIEHLAEAALVMALFSA